MLADVGGIRTRLSIPISLLTAREETSPAKAWINHMAKQARSAFQNHTNPVSCRLSIRSLSRAPAS
jgi:hypothetical protein